MHELAMISGEACGCFRKGRGLLYVVKVWEELNPCSLLGHDCNGLDKDLSHLTPACIDGMCYDDGSCAK